MTEDRKKKVPGKGFFTHLEGSDRWIFFAVCFLTVFLPVLYPTIQGKGFYHLADDIDNQMLPFLYNFRNAFSDGLNTYLWNLDLGTPAMYAYGYYGMGSLFYYPSLLVSASIFPYIVAGLVIAKYLLACYTAQGFLRRFTASPRTAAVGALLYAFSGLQSTNISFYCFHDVTAVFPLLLIAGEELLRKTMKDEPAVREGLLLSAAVAVNALTNYVFFVQSALALVLYYLFRVDKNRGAVIRSFFRFLFYSLLGAGLAGILYVPNMLYIMGNRRNGPSVLSAPGLYDLPHFLYIIKGFLLPGDAMMDESCLVTYVWLSADCYLPLVGMVLVIAYLLKKRTWLQRLLLFLILLSFFPWGNGFFLLFTISYHRWWYFLILLMALASVLVLEDMRSYPVKWGAAIQAGMILCWTAAVFALRGTDGESLVFHRGRLLLMIAFSLLSVLGVLYLNHTHDRNATRFFRLTVLGVAGCAALMLVFTEYLYRHASPVLPRDYEDIRLAAAELPDIPEEYRYRNYKNPLILYASGENISGIGSYSSTVSTSIVEFDDLFGYWHESLRMNKNKIAGLPELLGGKYLALGEPETEEIFPDAVTDADKKVIKTFEADGRKWEVYELEACPIGYAVDTLISYEELMKLPVEKRGIALLYAPVVSEADIASDHTGLFPETVRFCTAEEVLSEIQDISTDMEGDALFVHPAVRLYTERNEKNRIADFYRDPTGFGGTTTYSEEKLVWFSIPYDTSWQITIDGRETDPIDSGGLMLLDVPAGEHRIEAVYRLKGATAGVLTSLLCLVILGVLLWYRRRTQGNNP